MSSASCNFECKLRVCPPLLTIRLYRELDVLAAERLAWPAWAELKAVSVLLIDLRGLTFCDSAGLAAVQSLCDTAQDRGWDVRVRGVSPLVRKVARITGIAEKWILEA